MKQRTGYVSNSSSSSYIIAYENNASETIVSKNGTKIVFSVDTFIKWVEKQSWRCTCSDDTEIHSQDIDEIISIAEEDKKYNEDYYKEKMDFLMKNKGKNFVDFDIAYSDVEIKQYLLTLIKLGLLEVFADESALKEDK